MTTKKPGPVRGFITVEWRNALNGGEHVYVVEAEQQLEDDEPILLCPITPDGSVGGLERWMGKPNYELSGEERARLRDEWWEGEPIDFDGWLREKRRAAIQTILDKVKEPTP